MNAANHPARGPDGDYLGPYLVGVLEDQPLVHQIFYGALFIIGVLFPLLFAGELFAFPSPAGWKSRVFWFLQAVLGGLAAFGLQFTATFKVIFTTTTRLHFDGFIGLLFFLCVWSLFLAVVPGRASGFLVFPFRRRRERSGA